MIPLKCPECEADVPSRIKKIVFPTGESHSPSTPRRNHYEGVCGHDWIGEPYIDDGPSPAIDLRLFDDLHPGSSNKKKGSVDDEYPHQGHTNFRRRRGA